MKFNARLYNYNLLTYILAIAFIFHGSLSEAQQTRRRQAPRLTPSLNLPQPQPIPSFLQDDQSSTIDDICPLNQRECAFIQNLEISTDTTDQTEVRRQSQSQVTDNATAAPTAESPPSTLRFVSDQLPMTLPPAPHSATSSTPPALTPQLRAGRDGEVIERVISRLVRPNQQEINFLEDESVIGEIPSTSVRRPSRRPQNLIQCLDDPGMFGRVWRDLRERNRVESSTVSEAEFTTMTNSALRNTVRCIYPCMNDAEVTRFLGCIQTRPEDQNVACVDAMEAQARQSNPSFNYWQPDAQTNRCLAPLRSPPSWARQIEEEVTRTHQCPQSFTSIYQLTQFAMDQKRRSYDTRRFPSPGTYTICGYNNTNFNWFRVNLTVVNENQFYHQDAPGYPNTCLNYQRIEPDRSTFIINGPACHSGRSYRQGGSLGDTELIPLTSNVWIIIHLRPDFGIYFAGLVFR